MKEKDIKLFSKAIHEIKKVNTMTKDLLEVVDDLNEIIDDLIETGD